MLSIPITKTDCFEQLAINAIGPRHVKVHIYFLTHFRIFYKGVHQIFLGLRFWDKKFIQS